MSPKEALEHKNICPVCKKELTIGVEHRVEELADRPEGGRSVNAVEFHNLIPLEDILPAAACKERDISPQEERIDNIIRSFQDKYL